MKKLNIDMDALMECFILTDDESGDSYLDTVNGGIIYIPKEISEALERGALNLDNFPEWMHESVSEALLIAEDLDNRYILIPRILEEFLEAAIKEYVTSKIEHDDIREELQKVVNNGGTIRDIKGVLLKNGDEIDKWYRYEDEKKIEFALNWLRDNGIELEK